MLEGAVQRRLITLSPVALYEARNVATVRLQAQLQLPLRLQAVHINSQSCQEKPTRQADTEDGKPDNLLPPCKSKGTHFELLMKSLLHVHLQQQGLLQVLLPLNVCLRGQGDSTPSCAHGIISI